MAEDATKSSVNKYILMGFLTCGVIGYTYHYWNKLWKVNELNKIKNDNVSMTETKEVDITQVDTTQVDKVVDKQVDTTEFNETVDKELNENIKSNDTDSISSITPAELMTTEL